MRMVKKGYCFGHDIICGQCFCHGRHGCGGHSRHRHHSCVHNGLPHGPDEASIIVVMVVYMPTTMKTMYDMDGFDKSKSNRQLADVEREFPSLSGFRDNENMISGLIMCLWVYLKVTLYGLMLSKWNLERGGARRFSFNWVIGNPLYQERVCTGKVLVGSAVYRNSLKCSLILPMSREINLLHIFIAWWSIQLDNTDPI